MQIHSLPGRGERKKKRIGRGGKRGTYSGRGIKGQKSRAGAKIRPAERDVVLRMPKSRGTKNARKSLSARVVNVGIISKIFGEKSVVDMAALRKKKLISSGYRGRVKILGMGKMTHALTLKGLSVSGVAKEKIVKAGGTIS